MKDDRGWASGHVRHGVYTIYWHISTTKRRIRLLSLVNTLPTRCDLNTSEGMCIIRGSRVVTVVHNGIEI